VFVLANNVLIEVWAVWILFYAYWWIASGRVKRTERRESAASRISYMIVTIAAFMLLFVSRARVGFLGWRFIALSLAIEYAGLGVTVAGALFAVWARLIIGRNWSSAVTIKQDHELIRQGPYAFLRHPIYSGILLMVLGTAITIGEVRGLIAFALAFLGFRMKSLVEERFMAEQFGGQYADYQRHVKALIPFLY